MTVHPVLLPPQVSRFQRLASRRVLTTGFVTAALLTLGLPAVAAESTATSTCFGRPVTITGAGTINGTPGDDVIVGSAGDDVIDGLGGHDRICGLSGADTIAGASGTTGSMPATATTKCTVTSLPRVGTPPVTATTAWSAAVGMTS